MKPKPLAPLPKPEDVAARVNQLRAVMFDKITPDAVGDVVGKLVEKARDGDLPAIKLVLGYLSPQLAAAPPAIGPAQVEPSGPSVAVLRRLAALFLHTHGSAVPAAMAAQLDVPVADLDMILGCELFQRDALGWTLTPAGRRAVG